MSLVLIHVTDNPGTRDTLALLPLDLIPYTVNQVLERGFGPGSTEVEVKGATIKVLIQRIQVLLLCLPLNGENDDRPHLSAMGAAPESTRGFPRRRVLLTHIVS